MLCYNMLSEHVLDKRNINIFLKKNKYCVTELLLRLKWGGEKYVNLIRKIKYYYLNHPSS